MFDRRSAAVLAAAGVAALAGVWPASPASAHGAPSSPVSRAFACRPDGGNTAQPACQAALAANGQPLGPFDNLRVPGVNGQDRQFIPDGQLCSGDLPEYQGLDLPRADWPSTTLTAGAQLTMRYTSTIPHKGTFRVYATKPGYDPTKPLTWGNLDDQPFLTATDPPLADGAYTFAGALPADRVGRHVLYTVWQNSDTVDTYYSCSDVVFGAAAAVAPPAANRAQPRVAPGDSPGLPGGSTAGPGPSASASRGPGAQPPGQRESWIGAADPIADGRVALGQQIMSAALIVIVGVTAGLAYLRIRAGRPQGLHRRPGNR
jgi:predicted carbohydrate-binding protein with CBM5 and CBM33 domain